MTATAVPLTPDVCIVGAGPAGLVAASTLGEAGRTVLVVESGSRVLSADDQGLNDGDTAGEPYVGLIDSRHRGLGGTVNIWNVQVGGEPGAKYVPLSPRDLADWPISWRELEAYYQEAQIVCGLGPFDYGAENWASDLRRPFDLSGTALSSGVYQFGFGSRFTAELPRRLGERPNVTLLPSTTVVAVAETTGGGTSMRAVGGDGRALEITPRVLVLACGAVENARLLLAAGFGSTLPWLGAGFMEHARDFSLSIGPADPDVFAAASFYDLHEASTGHLIGGRLAFTDDVLDAEALPNASMTLFPRPRVDTSLRGRVRRAIRNGGNVRAGPYGWGQGDLDGMAFADFKLILNMEQRPTRSNGISLSDRTDRFGNRLPSLMLSWTSDEQAALDRLRSLIDESLRSAGIGRLRYQVGGRPDLSAHHHAGTTRMAVDATHGVVDHDGRLFGSERVFLAGASVFPSAGFANPTLTIVAMAIRLGRHVDEVLG